MGSALLLSAWIACQSLDIGSTVYALNQHGFREGNGLLRGMGKQMYTVKIGVNVGAFIWRQKSSNPHAKWIIPSAMAIGGCVPGALNVRTIQAIRRGGVGWNG